MKRNLYYTATHRRENLLKKTFLGFFQWSASYPRLLLEVFIRKDFGERYFQLGSALWLTFLLALWPVLKTKLINPIRHLWHSGAIPHDLAGRSVSHHPLAAAEITRQRTVRNGAIGGSLLLLIAGASTFGFYKRKRDADQAQKDAELKAQVTDTELKALRAQMNPHFIFNSLNSVSDYISRNETQAANNYLTKFARLMRTILENSEEKEVPLAEDLEALDWYIQLEALRMNHKFTYTINISADIDPQAIMIPPMILQPFVENSIWHGLSRKTDDNGHINIEMRKDGQMLCCTVEDNGIGRSGVVMSAAMPGKTSLGMKITQSRIDVINQQKGTNASIQLTDLSQGMRAEIKLPLLLKF